MSSTDPTINLEKLAQQRARMVEEQLRARGIRDERRAGGHGQGAAREIHRS